MRALALSRVTDPSLARDTRVNEGEEEGAHKEDAKVSEKEKKEKHSGRKRKRSESKEGKDESSGGESLSAWFR